MWVGGRPFASSSGRFGDVTNPSLLFQGLAFSSGFAYLAVMVFFVGSFGSRP